MGITLNFFNLHRTIKEYMYPKIDYLYYNGQPCRNMDVVAVIYRESANSTTDAITFKRESIAQIMFSNQEGIELFEFVNARLTNLCGVIPESIDRINQRYSQFGMVCEKYAVLGSLNDFDFFDDTLQNIKVGIAMTNDYENEGQLEFLLWYNFDMIDDSKALPFYKWTARTSSITGRELSIGYNFRNFNNRQDIIDKVSEEIALKIVEGIKEFKELICNFQQITIEPDTVLPVLLDIKNMNRSLTGLQSNKDRLWRISNDLHYFEQAKERILRRTDNTFRYDLFLALLSLQGGFSFHNMHFKQSNLRSSNAYKDLLKKMNTIMQDDFRLDYEREQMQLYNQIIQYLQQL